jgi:hypothetical protein
MNHSSTVHSISAQLAERDALLPYTNNGSIPFILGETNSLYNQGKPGLSNSFGAALWGLDFNLWCASQGIKRVHMHQGTNYRYQSWQPVETDLASIGTKAPYYGNVAVAAFLGNLTAGEVRIANLPRGDEREAAYAAYVDGRLERVAVVNMREYNYTVNGTSDLDMVNLETRPSQTYSFQLPSGYGGKQNGLTVQRLWANGSDAVTGITFDGWSFNYELDMGRPVRLHNVTVGEEVCPDSNRIVRVVVPDSSAVILGV